MAESEVVTPRVDGELCLAVCLDHPDPLTPRVVAVIP